ncbi:hypothetical protein [Epilithonimonas hispanica]|uniref:VCBS repeat-containing protein n=1 Tax=Epilithonimonas hispanica TaxID=358687 RepID=A0A3D9D358_9FLAO|nr:hypothetical protein [Epilithonimonas hispanica]REC72446.1 hypothetical protein DRF58_02230 [Epilithonimonas hispanica]
MFSKKFLLLLNFPSLFFAQEKMLSADFDGDHIKDKVYLDSNNGAVVYQLSSQKFKKISSNQFEDSGEIFFDQSKNGFKVKLNQMRAGYVYQFRYEKEIGKMRLIGMERYEFGPANNDGSGESSVNLLTNTYIGEWNYFDNKKTKLIKIPTIKKKMVLPKAYFDNLGNVFSTYIDKDTSYYLAEKKRLYKE